jgi:predicted RecB family nuclease
MRRDGEGRLVLAATDLVSFLECGHKTTLDRAVAEGVIERPHERDDPTTELLQKRGIKHERRYIEQLTAAGRTVEEVPERDAAATLAAMRAGRDVVYQGTFEHDGWVGHPDFLLRTEGASDLGDYHYEIADTKLARIPKAAALVQMCTYVEQLEQIQGKRPERVYVVTGGETAEEHSFRTAELLAYYRHQRQRLQQVLAAPLDIGATTPEPVEHCGVCRWRVRCNRQWHDEDVLGLVYGISRGQRAELKQMDPPITTRRALAESSVDGKLGRVREQARLQVESTDAGVVRWELLEPERDGEGGVLADRGLSALPEPSVGDLFFDIEGDPFAYWTGLEYLFGVWDGTSYEATWALTQAEEKQAFERVIDGFVQRLADHPDMHVYHYGSYEPSRLKTLAGRHATREEELDDLLRRRVFVDLFRVVRQGVRVGSEGYSIKDLEPLYAFGREIDLRTAGDSIAEFELWLESDERDQRLLDDIAAYNKDDCVSTQQLREWLEARRPEAEAQFAVTLPRASAGEPAKDDLTDRQARVANLYGQLQEAADAHAASGRDEEAKATRLLADLLDWHRREDKQTWWRYFDLMGKTPEELVDEQEPIGGLEFIDSRPIPPPSRSNAWRYSFPEQDFKIEERMDVDDPALGFFASTGEVITIDEAKRELEIRRVRGWNGPHPKAIVNVNVIPATEQFESLMALGGWVAEHGIEADLPDWRAARDLLLRRPPRLVGGAALDQPGEAGAEAALRVAPLLDGTTLAIQGPPGSGKSTRGSQMIAGLVAAGRPVGITSNSHEVISNLLRKALEAGVPSAIQKAKEHEGVKDARVRRVEDNPAMVAALSTGGVGLGAGTVWLWARSDMARSVDTLFVDEAGQVSLANVLAASRAARNIVLLGDPQQLDQPTGGVHPDGAERSALAHILGEEKVMPADKGLFLEHTHRMHPGITDFTSALFYDGALEGDPRLDLARQEVLGDGLPADFAWLAGSGLRWVGVEHVGRTNESVEEADVVADLWRRLLRLRWTDRHGQVAPITARDVLIISPFNAHRLRIQRLLGPSALVGTVDKFQGQQAPVSIYTMATSRAEDAPRGMDFLYSLNRLNVATSRAQALAIMVASPTLLDAVARTPDQLRMANGLAAFTESASREPRPLAATPALP